jgi:hypothetical protein
MFRETLDNGIMVPGAIVIQLLSITKCFEDESGLTKDIIDEE